MDVGGEHVHVRAAGDSDAPVVVLIHGAASSSRYMVPLLQALSSEFRVFAPDLPGFGKSPSGRIYNTEGLAQWLVDWMAVADLEEVTVIGNPYGCQVAVEAACLAPNRIQQLVFVGPTVDSEALSISKQVFRMLRGLPWEPKWYYFGGLRDVQDCGLQRAFATFRHMLKHDMLGRARAVPQPVTVMRGSHDYVCSEKWAAKVAVATKAGAVIPIRSAAHDAHTKRPSAVVEVLKFR